MANLKFSADSRNPDDNIGSVVTVENFDIEWLGDMPDVLLTYLRAMGYNYVDTVVVIQNDGKEFSSL